MIAASIWRHDQYSLRKYQPGSIDFFLDIGGCVGTASVLFKAIDPFARVIALEPSKEDFNIMSIVAGEWDIECWNIAFGDGTPLRFDRRKRGSHRFYTNSETQWGPDKPEYLVQSMTLPELVRQFNIRGRYIIKMDCEGGERFLLEDRDAIDIIKGCVQFTLEYHKGFGGDQKRWREWFCNFNGTHTLMRRTKHSDLQTFSNFVPSKGPNGSYRAEFMLVKKE